MGVMNKDIRMKIKTIWTNSQAVLFSVACVHVCPHVLARKKQTKVHLDIFLCTLDSKQTHCLWDDALHCQLIINMNNYIHCECGEVCCKYCCWGPGCFFPCWFHTAQAFLRWTQACPVCHCAERKHEQLNFIYRIRGNHMSAGTHSRHGWLWNFRCLLMEVLKWWWILY